MSRLRLTSRSGLALLLFGLALWTIWSRRSGVRSRKVPRTRLEIVHLRILPSSDISNTEAVHDFDKPPLPGVDRNVSRSPHLYRTFVDQPRNNPRGFDLSPFLQDVPILQGECLHSWLTEGVLESRCHADSMPSGTASSEPYPPLRISFVHTYLNGSDPLWQVNKQAYSAYTQIGRTQSVPDRHYRDHGELRASLRARAKAFDHLSDEARIHIDGFVVLADWPTREDGQEEALASRNSNMMDTPLRRLGWMDERARIGQTPDWYDWKKDGAYVGSGSEVEGHSFGARLKLVWHSQMWNSFSLAVPAHQAVEPGLLKAVGKRYGAGLTIIPAEDRERTSIRRQALLVKALPTFNSFAIESMLWNTPGVSSQYVYMNDDFFLLTPHNPTDFHTPSSIYGPIIPFIFAESNYTNPAKPKWPPRPQPDSRGWFRARRPYQNQQVPPSGGFVNYPATSVLSCNHEWSSLTRANRLLGARFGLRQRPGHMHIPKPVLTPMMHEAAFIWGADFARSSTRRFREDGRTKPGDINAMFISEMLLVERAREAMLWTWVVAKLGEESDVPGMLGRKANQEIRRVLKIPHPTRQPLLGFFGGNDVQEVVIPETNLSNRHTLRRDRVSEALKAMSQDAPLATEYGWSSLDGPLPPFGATVYNCSIVFYSCFGSWWTRAFANEDVYADAAKMFKRIAFEQPQCGDCLLSGVIQASGKLGMRDLLPPGDLEFSVFGDDGDEDEQPHLSFARTWSEADYSMEGVFSHGSWRGNINLRSWCERLVARYAWTAAANSTAIFRMLNGMKSIDDAFAAMETPPVPSCAVLNDDIPTPLRKGALSAQAEKMAEGFTVWLAEKWQTAGSWERTAA